MREVRPLVVALLAGAILLGAVPLAHAAFLNRATATAAFSTAEVSPPTGLTASAGCVLLVPTAELSWTASTTEFVSGYDVYRRLSTDTTFVLIGSVTGRTTTTYTDSTVTAGASYVYVVDAVYGSWTARSAEASISVPLVCL